MKETWMKRQTENFDKQGGEQEQGNEVKERERQGKNRNGGKQKKRRKSGVFFIKKKREHSSLKYKESKIIPTTDGKLS